jgi:hypothetical protein
VIAKTMQMDPQTRTAEVETEGMIPRLGPEGTIGQAGSGGLASAVPSESRTSFRVASPGLSHMFETAVTAGPWVCPITPLEPQHQGARTEVWDAWLSGGTFWAEEREVTMPEPEIISDVSARPLITDRVRITVERLLELLNLVAWNCFAPVKQVEISGYVDPEESAGDEVVITQWVDLPPDEALEYWDKVEAAVEGLIGVLPTELADIAVDRVGIEVRWITKDGDTTLQSS